MENLLILTGPTGVGKTKLSLEIAENFNGEIISSDSMQIYKNMDIGTDKINLENLILKIRQKISFQKLIIKINFLL